MSPDVERLRPLVDESILWAYLHGVDRFRTTDLVVYFEKGKNPQAFLRGPWLEEPSLPENVKQKLQVSGAVEAKVTGTQTAFWFVVGFGPGDMAAMPIISQRMQDGGDA